MSNYKVLVIESDDSLPSFTKQYLEKHEFTVSVASYNTDLSSCISNFQPDLLLLDLMGACQEGFAACSKIRALFDKPIFMISSDCEEETEIRGLEIGADGYLCMPFNFRLLLAHLRALLRRSNSGQELASRDRILVNEGNIVIDTNQQTVTKNGQHVQLTYAEYEMLLILAKSAGSIASRDQLHSQIFRFEYDGLDRPVDLRISRLRKKLGDNPRNPTIIKTVRNKGYLLCS